MECIKVVEIHGGTSGTDYMYVLRGKKLYHVSQLPGVKLIKRGEWGRGRKYVEWCVPADVIAGSEGIWVSFSRSRGCFNYYFRLPSRLEGVGELSPGEMIKRGFIDNNFREPLMALSKEGVMFEPFGPETYQLRIYEVEVPRLVREIWGELRSMGINSVYAGGHAERSVEMLYDPIYAELMSMVLPTPQGRVRSLYEKNTRAVELYVLVKVLKALYELGFRPLSDILLIEYTTNRPAMAMRSPEGVQIDVLYQPTIVPHITSGAVPTIPKPFHAIPDIALVVPGGEVIGWGGLADISDRVILIIEVKYELGYQTIYEDPDTAVNQVMAYKALLKGIPEAVVAIYKSNPGAAHRLRASGIECIDGVNPDNSGRVRELMDLVKRTVGEKVRRAV